MTKTLETYTLMTAGAAEQGLCLKEGDATICDFKLVGAVSNEIWEEIYTLTEASQLNTSRIELAQDIWNEATGLTASEVAEAMFDALTAVDAESLANIRSKYLPDDPVISE